MEDMEAEDFIQVDDENLEENEDDYEGSDSNESSASENESLYDSPAKKKGRYPNIRKDGMAICERCGTIGVKHAFYSKTKKFCSLQCARNMPPLSSGGKTSSNQTKTTKRPLSQSTPKDNTLKKPKIGFSNGSTATKKKVEKAKTFKKDVSGSFDWMVYLDDKNFQAASVSSFKHVPLSESWENVTIGMKLEVENKDYDKISFFTDSYWIATVVKISGYFVKLRYEGFGNDDSMDFWYNLCVSPIYPVGWCASKGKPLIPPKSIENKYNDWKEFLVKRLTGARTLPNNFKQKVQEGMKGRFAVGTKLEVVDKNRISSVRVATVDEVVGGRLHVSYEAADPEDEGFWCHERSPLIHPIGWGQVVGHNLRASVEYAKKSLQKTILRQFEPNDATWDMFSPVKNPPSHLKFQIGMKLEAIDPLNLSTVCVATVTKVLRNNYLMIGIDGMMAANGSDWFCYHASSPCIFPVGFCELNDILLTPPRGYKGEFRWFNYLKETKSVAAPVGLFKRDIPNHGFKAGMQLEAVDLMEPRLICVGSITRVVGRLLRLHFDGWDVTYDQWCDCESADLFPVGWSQVVGYRLEPPRQEGNGVVEVGYKKKKKYPAYKGSRKKKKPRSSQKLGPEDQLVTIKQEFDDTVSSTWDFDSSQMQEDEDMDSFISFEFNNNELIDIKSLDLAKPQDIIRKPGISGIAMSSVHSDVNPNDWSVLDVAQFLRINECGAYCQTFSQQKIDGNKFLSLTKEDIMNLTGMKVGPSLKISDLVRQLQSEVSRRQ